MVVPDGAAGLDDVLYAALAGTLHIVATVTPDWRAIHSFFSSAVSTSGRILKVFCHTPSASTSSYSSER